jgi:hypothetical protein
MNDRQSVIHIDGKLIEIINIDLFRLKIDCCFYNINLGKENGCIKGAKKILLL